MKISLRLSNNNKFDFILIFGIKKCYFSEYVFIILNEALQKKSLVTNIGEIFK